MRFLFRVDADQDIGFGHIIRTISIADKIKELFPDCLILFLISNHPVPITRLKGKGYSYIVNKKTTEEEFLLNAVSETDCNVLFIDKLYNYSSEFIDYIREFTKVILLHNICDGRFNCDTFILPASHVYKSIIEDKRWKNGIVKFYEGSKYIVINEDILKVRKIRRRKKEKIKTVITTGGSDPKGVMLKIQEWIKDFNINDVEIISLTGQAFKHKDKLEKIKLEINSNIKIVPYDTKFLADADLAISTFGVSTYELLYLGIPVISIVILKKMLKGVAF